MRVAREKKDKVERESKEESGPYVDEAWCARAKAAGRTRTRYRGTLFIKKINRGMGSTVNMDGTGNFDPRACNTSVLCRCICFLGFTDNKSCAKHFNYPVVFFINKIYITGNVYAFHDYRLVTNIF